MFILIKIKYLTCLKKADFKKKQKKNMITYLKTYKQYLVWKFNHLSSIFIF